MSKSIAAYDNKGFETETAAEAVLNIEEKQRGNKRETLTYSWENLNVFAPISQGCCSRKKIEDKHILKNVTGICRPGELLAVMGASGAGKTTLLNCLNFRSNPSLKIKGKLYVNGRRLTPDLLTSRSAYVQQEDIFVGTVTVREQLIFQANLRMDRDLAFEERMQRVDDVMVELNLVNCADTLIGIPGVIKGISGGELKRLAFACEVLTDPPIMFCDEPTTGLDSFMAQTIVEAMKNLARKGKTIISTIHQPSSEVFALFNQVLLMAEGRTAYLGSIDGALDFFAGLGRICPDNYNPADFFISQLAIQPEKEEECRQFVTAACDSFEGSTAGQDITRDAQNNSKGGMNGGAHANGKMKQKAPSPYKVGWGSQFAAIFKRSTLENVRNINVLRVKVVQALAIPLIIGLIYLNQTMDQSGAQNINGALFLVLTQISFSSTFSVINAFCAEVPVFLREHFSGMYRVDSYFLAKNAAELPLNIFLPAVFVSIYYYMVGFNALVERFFMHMLIIELVSNTVTSFGFMISCLARDETIATGLAPPMVVSLMLFGGLYLNSQTIPNYLIWLKYISWFSYSFEDLSINQWKEFGNITCEELNPEFCLNNGQEILDSLGFKEENFALNILLLVVLLVGFRLLAFLFLLNKTMRKTVMNYE